MMKLIRIAKWGSLFLGIILVAGYNAFVQWQYSKLPEKMEPTSLAFSKRIQNIYWHAEFGKAPMAMEPYPFWKLLLLMPSIIRNHGKSPPSFSAAALASKRIIDSQSPPLRTAQRALTELFGAIWISKHWSAEETANTLLGSAYFCHDFSGIEQAARGYYGFPVEELTNEEVAFLSGISRSPCRYSPWLDRKKAGERAIRVLDALSKDPVLQVMADTNACFRRLKPHPVTAPTQNGASASN